MASPDRPEGYESRMNDQQPENQTLLASDRINQEKNECEKTNSDQVDDESFVKKSCYLENVNIMKTSDGRGLDIQESKNNSNIQDESSSIELSKADNEEPDAIDKKEPSEKNNTEFDADTETYARLNCDDSNNQNDSKMNKTDDIKDTELEYFSDQSDSGDEYESAEEGEDIQTDSTNLKELEETLTEEEKEERRNISREMKEEGNQLFKDGSYKSAIRLYSRGLRTCPLMYEKDRSVLYANRGACKVKLEEFEDAIKDCSKALDLNPDYMKVLQRRAELYEKLDKLDEALADYQKILDLDPGQHKARAACMKLPEMIKEKNEKLKEEMMGKLKELGNMVLRPFGLSTNNFKMQQDPNTGGYSVNFVQNPDNGS